MLCLTYDLCVLQVKYTGYRDRPIEERRSRFRSDIISGHAEMVSSSRGVVSGWDVLDEGRDKTRGVVWRGAWLREHRALLVGMGVVK